MATQSPGFTISYAELASALLSSSEVAPRARLIAQQVAGIVPGTAIVVYVMDEEGRWEPKATEGEVAFMEAVIQQDAGTLGALFAKRDIVTFNGAELPREEYAHLNVRRTVVSLVEIPLLVEEELVGAIEVITFDRPIPPPAMQSLRELAHLAALGIAAGRAYEHERNSQLQSITRVTQMYDLEKVFNSTLEMDELLQVIARKFQEVMEVQAANLWMVEGDEVVLYCQAGQDDTVRLDQRQKPGDGVAGDISDTGEAVLISDPEDPRLKRRNAAAEEGKVFSLLAVPLMEGESLVGVAEVVNRADGQPFDDDDEFLLSNICGTANNALHNASLLLAERKVEVLEALVKVSSQITSTLDLDKVLDAVVNEPATVIPYERATVALEQRGRLLVRAVTGMPMVNPNDPDVERLQQLLEWAAVLTEPLLVTQHGEEVEADREETRAKFAKYFSQTGMRGVYIVPLSDDDGRVGMLSLESSDPDFLNQAHLEMIQILGSQTTVALRNASLYREVPFIDVLQPVLERKRKFLALEKRRRHLTVAAAAAVALFLAVFPLPLRVDGNAVVAPARSARVQPEVEGVVKRVNVREGDPVRKGTVLAQLEDWEYRAALAAAQAKYEAAVSQMNKALATNDGTEAGIQRVQADYWAAEVERAKQRLERTNLRSPIDGVVATPHIEDAVGKMLKFGDPFAEVVDTSQADVDVAVDERDVDLLQPGDRASVKLEGFPARTFRGEVRVVSPKSQVQDDERVFFARVSVPNADAAIRAGMQGRGKVMTGWRPSGVVFFRRPAMWLWSKLWSWFGW